MPLISVQNLSVYYDRKPVLSDISFEVEQGDYICIVGENGSGKTTLMKGILGLIPIKNGSLVFAEGVKMSHIGYLPQYNPVQKDFPASVFEVVLSGCLNQMNFKPFYTRREKIKAKKNMALLGILDIKNKSYKTLSGGQQQRVLLARALCATDKILFLDEPVSGLDPRITTEFYEVIKELNRSGITVVMISHDVKAAVKNANKILHLDNNLVFFGTTENYLNSTTGKMFLWGGENDRTDS